MLAAIEIYNKPNFEYREETFAILCINSWELLFKSIYLKRNKYKLDSLYVHEDARKKDGSVSKRKRVKHNRSGFPMTQSLQFIIGELKKVKMIDEDIEQNIMSLIDIRDNSIHFYNYDKLTKPMQELGFAAIKNYIRFIQKNNVEIDISNYNFYLMPLAYINDKVEAEAILTENEQKYIKLLASRLKQHREGAEYDIAISIEINFNKSKSIDAIGMKYSPDGIPVVITEEDKSKSYPLRYSDVVKKCQERYSDFKQKREFYDIMREIKKNEKLTYTRKLDKSNPKSQKKDFFNSNIFAELDKYYTKKS